MENYSLSLPPSGPHPSGATVTHFDDVTNVSDAVDGRPEPTLYGNEIIMCSERTQHLQQVFVYTYIPIHNSTLYYLVFPFVFPFVLYIKDFIQQVQRKKM